MREPLTGKVVFITGAARGIGAETARAAAARGARLALTGLEPELLEALAAELNAAGGLHVWYRCDVTDQAALYEAAARTAEDLGGIDVVVANAGIANMSTVAVSPPDELIKVIDVNLNGVIRTVSATLPYVTEAEGFFLLVSSAASFSALPAMAAYSASKAGIEHFGSALRLELAHKGVGVGTVHPAWIDTDMVREIRADLHSFNDIFHRMPGPLGTYSSAERCAEAMIKGIEKRRRRIYVPRSVVLLQAMRWVFLSHVTDAYMRVAMPGVVPNIESEVEALGRRFSERTLTEHALTAPPPADPALGPGPEGGPSVPGRGGTEAGEHGRLDDPHEGIGEQ